jgi:hypothetical protein
MQKYRAYIIGQNGRTEFRVDLFCSDDHAARQKAKQLANGRDVELWQGANRIEIFKATH